MGPWDALMVSRATLYTVPVTRSRAGASERGEPVETDADVPCQVKTATRTRVLDNGREQQYTAYRVTFTTDVGLKADNLIRVDGGPYLFVRAYAEASAGRGWAWQADAEERS